MSALHDLGRLIYGMIGAGVAVVAAVAFTVFVVWIITLL